MELVKIGIEKTIVSEKMCKTSNSTFIIIIIIKKRQMAIRYWLNRLDPTLLLYSFSSLSPTLHKIIN